MGSTIVFMMRRVHLSNTDLEMVEQACRAFAERYRQDAERQANPLIRGNALENAARYDRLAERMQRFR